MECSVRECQSKTYINYDQTVLKFIPSVVLADTFILVEEEWLSFKAIIVATSKSTTARPPETEMIVNQLAFNFLFMRCSKLIVKLIDLLERLLSVVELACDLSTKTE